MKNVRVLVVDDDTLNLGYVRMILEYFLNRDVLMYTNGHDAWEHIQENPVDLVVTDVKMPYINGIQLTELIKKNYPKIIVVVMSDDKVNMRQAYSAGADMFLDKPVSRDQLIYVVEHFITKQVEKGTLEKIVVEEMD